MNLPSEVNLVDFEGYNVSNLLKEDDWYRVRCITCGYTYGNHSGTKRELARCRGGKNTFVPDLPLLRPRFELPEDLFEI